MQGQAEDTVGWVMAFLFAGRLAREAAASLLSDRSAEVDQADGDGAMPLYIAALLSYESAARLLHDHSAEVNRAVDDGATTLRIVVQLLPGRRADVDDGADFVIVRSLPSTLRKWPREVPNLAVEATGSSSATASTARSCGR